MNIASDTLRCATWHGKLPSTGDFIGRRMESEFLDKWDEWLSESLSNLQQRPDWLEQYLQCPAWRFLLLPGVMDERTWCGVLMPSVDRVGRYYPLTLTLALATNEGRGVPRAQRLFTWLASLEEVAYSAVNEEWSADTLENRLLHMGAPESAEDSHVPAPLAWQAHLAGKSCWYASPAGMSPRLLVCDGLHAKDLGAALLTPA
jgi:type VI secretion system protein ImpM